MPVEREAVTNDQRAALYRTGLFLRMRIGRRSGIVSAFAVVLDGETVDHAPAVHRPVDELAAADHIILLGTEILRRHHLAAVVAVATAGAALNAGLGFVAVAAALRFRHHVHGSLPLSFHDHPSLNPLVISSGASRPIPCRDRNERPITVRRSSAAGR